MSLNVKILDGGFSTQLTKHVGDKVDGHPLWTARFLVTNPEAIVQTHLDFLKSGADFIETCSYQASFPGLMKHLKIDWEEASALIRKSADLANEAVGLYTKDNPGAKPQVVGSIGPYGAALNDASEYTGAYADRISEDELKDWHRPRIDELYKSGVRVFAFETVPCQKEGEALASLLSEYEDIKAWISFSCKSASEISNGENFQETAKKCYSINPKQILAVGCNCTHPGFISSLFRGINKDPKNPEIPLVVYPNSGEKYSVENGWDSNGNVPPLKTFVEEWLNLGVKYIGGCCRTYAEDIEMIRDEVRQWQQK